MNTFILGTGTALPNDPVDNTLLHETFGINAQWVDHFVGTRTRYFGVDLDSGEQTHGVVDLGTEAAEAAIGAAGIDRVDLDFIVLATATPDTLMPTAATGVADRLGLDLVPAYQVQSGCAGAVQALDVGRRLLDDDHRTGLVIGADVCAKHMVLDRGAGAMPPSKLVNYMLFGDGAGAVVISADPDGALMRLGRVVSRFEGRNRLPGQVIEWFGDADLSRWIRTETGTDRQAVTEDYKAIELYVPHMAGEMFTDLLRLARWKVEEVDYVLPPQLSGKMSPRIRAALGADRATEISCVAETGNSGNALSFLQLDRLARCIEPGQRAIAVAIESSRWIKGGFAVEGVNP
ncbi:3-oxoacyl-ACP synthase III family protein [Rhodococcus pyridinivorans]|uniref:3-oxoacyl-ACP synthase III family protein n=1 Tax=Rhodococcus pyridinivorans TaxID=103816 RepID=UPI001906861B|nr:3-oxoacyl-ACP synthase III family protein [Rhodococcus pyridinivorans]QQM53964.1 3-oxoacyl-ACP synthase III family protein [Rhodococcus pyridinivorans]